MVAMKTGRMAYFTYLHQLQMCASTKSWMTSYPSTAEIVNADAVDEQHPNPFLVPLRSYILCARFMHHFVVGEGMKNKADLIPSPHLRTNHGNSGQ